MNRRGVEVGFVVKIVLWIAILLVFAYIIMEYIVKGGDQALGPVDALLPLVLIYRNV